MNLFGWNFGMSVFHVFLQVPAVSSAIAAHWTVMVIDILVVGDGPLTRSRRWNVLVIFVYRNHCDATVFDVVQEASFVCVAASALVANVRLDGSTVVAARAVSSCNSNKEYKLKKFNASW